MLRCTDIIEKKVFDPKDALTGAIGAGARAAASRHLNVGLKPAGASAASIRQRCVMRWWRSNVRQREGYCALMKPHRKWRSLARRLTASVISPQIRRAICFAMRPDCLHRHSPPGMRDRQLPPRNRSEKCPLRYRNHSQPSWMARSGSKTPRCADRLATARHRMRCLQHQRQACRKCPFITGATRCPALLVKIMADKRTPQTALLGSR